jgi:hypothetical protein
MNWNLFGWFGLLSFCLFLGFLAFPAVTTIIPYKLGSISFLIVMFSSMVCPVIASIRSSKWWLVLSLGGMSSILWFFWHISA